MARLDAIPPRPVVHPACQRDRATVRRRQCEAKKLGYSIIPPSQTPSARRQHVTLRSGIGGASRLRKTVIENGRFWLVPSDDKIANVIGGFQRSAGL
jgi:hypothetical protein